MAFGQSARCTTARGVDQKKSVCVHTERLIDQHTPHLSSLSLSLYSDTDPGGVAQTLRDHLNWMISNRSA